MVMQRKGIESWDKCVGPRWLQPLVCTYVYKVMYVMTYVWNPLFAVGLKINYLESTSSQRGRYDNQWANIELEPSQLLENEFENFIRFILV